MNFNSWLWRLISVYETFTWHSHAIYVAHPYLWKFTSVLNQSCNQLWFKQDVWFLSITQLDWLLMSSNKYKWQSKQSNLLIWLKLPGPTCGQEMVKIWFGYHSSWTRLDDDIFRLSKEMVWLPQFWSFFSLCCSIHSIPSRLSRCSHLGEMIVQWLSSLLQN